MQTRRSRINENQKVTLTLGQLKRLVRESVEDNGDFEIENGVLVKYNGRGGNVVIPDGIEEIGETSFWCCEGLTSVSIPNSVWNIDDSAFWGCTGLKSVTIPDSVTRIGWDVFNGCTSLESVGLPPNLLAEAINNIDDIDYIFEDTPWAEKMKKKYGYEGTED